MRNRHTPFCVEMYQLTQISWYEEALSKIVDFLKSVVEKHLGVFLDDLSREECDSLMNALLTLDVREFQLAWPTWIFLTAFSTPDEGHHKWL